MKILGIILGGLFLIAAIAIYVSGRNYRVTKNQTVALLQKILENNTDCWAEWDNFTHIPITNNSILEKVRQRCVALEQNELLDSKFESFFNERGKEEIRKILAELESQ
jgi:hypothetical protein